MKQILTAFLFVLFLFNIVNAQENLTIRKSELSTNDFNEYGAIIYNQRLIYCSDKPTYGNIKYVSKTGTPFFDLVETKQFDSIKRTKALKISEPFNSRYSEGNVSIDSSGNLAIFTRTYLPIGKKGRIKGEATLTLYQSTRKNRDWTTPKAIFNPSKGQIFAQPTLSPDGKTLIFVSNIGNGSPDIYFSTKLDTSWSKPLPLQGPINTPAKEMFPFLSGNGDLYFSSDRNESIGGLDIFIARKNGDSYRKPVRLEKPINSTFDDYCYFKDTATSIVYFSSNRDGTDDIFESFSPEIDLICRAIPEKERCFVFYEDNLDALALDSVPMKYQWDVGDGTIYDGLEADHCFKDTGNYMISLNIIDTLVGEIFYSEAVFPFEIIDQQAVYIEAPDTVFVNETIKLNFPYYTINKYDNIQPLWDFDNGKTTFGDQTSVKYTQPGTYQLKASYGKGSVGVCNFKPIVVIKKED